MRSRRPVRGIFLLRMQRLLMQVSIFQVSAQAQAVEAVAHHRPPSGGDARLWPPSLH